MCGGPNITPPLTNIGGTTPTTKNSNAMNLQEFKSAHNISQLDFYKSKSSDRLCAYHGELSLVTTESFDASKEMRVYDNPGGIEGKDFILSNTVKKDEVMTL